MKKCKRILALALSLVLAASLAACGGNTAASSESTASAAGSTASAAASGTGTESTLSGELKFAFWDTNQEPGLVAQAARFMELNPGVKITVEITPWNEYWTKMQAAATGGNLADIFVMHPDQVEVYGQGNVLMDLTEITSSQVDMSKFPEYVNADFLVDGKQYAVPKDVGTMALLYNKDIFDAAGVAYPDSKWTWDDMAAAAEKLTDPAKDIYGFGAPNDGQNYYWNLIWSNGGEVMENGKCVMDSPKSIEAMEYAMSFIEKGYSPTASDFTTLTEEEYFQSGKIAMMLQGSWMLNQYLSAEGLNFDCAEIPSKDGNRVVICSGMGYSISSTTKNPDAAKAFMVFLGSEEGQRIQAETGICIPAYEGTQQPWIDMFKTIDPTPFVTGANYGHTSPGLTTTNEASLVIDELMPEIFDLRLPVAEGMKQISQRINEINGVS